MTKFQKKKCLEAAEQKTSKLLVVVCCCKTVAGALAGAGECGRVHNLFTMPEDFGIGSRYSVKMFPCTRLKTAQPIDFFYQKSYSK